MNSTRLPGKILMPLAGKPSLWHIVDRLSNCKHLERTVVATSTSHQDNAVEDFCKKYDIFCFRGSEKDVLDRFYKAAKEIKAAPVVRITGDCPVIDPVIVDEVITGFLVGKYDVYRLGGEFPDGLDCEIFSFSALKDAWQCANLPSQREHVSPYLYEHPEKYRIGDYKIFKGLENHRWTLDEKADYCFLVEIFKRLYIPDKIFLTQNILDLLEKEPELMEINKGIIRNAGYLKSLVEDRE